jgi:hypothetical protein
MAAVRERSTSERRVVKKARGGQASSVRWTTIIDVEETDLAHNSNSAVMVKTPATLYSSLAVVAAALPRPSPSPRKRPAHGVAVGSQTTGQIPLRPTFEKQAMNNQLLGQSVVVPAAQVLALLMPSSTAHSPAVMVLLPSNTCTHAVT